MFAAANSVASYIKVHHAEKAGAFTDLQKVGRRIITTNSDRKSVSENIGSKVFQPEDYHRSTELSQALAETHEQVSDVYTAGTSNGIMFDEDGQVTVIKRGQTQRQRYVAEPTGEGNGK